MTRRLSLRREAQLDIRDAANWYNNAHAGLGTEFTRAVRAFMARIEREPAHFAFADTEVRRALLRRFPYAVYFIVDDASVIVLACLHVRRDPSVWESRR